MLELHFIFLAPISRARSPTPPPRTHPDCGCSPSRTGLLPQVRRRSPCKAIGRAIRQHVNRPMAFQIDEDSPVALALTPRPVISTDCLDAGSGPFLSDRSCLVAQRLPMCPGRLTAHRGPIRVSVHRANWVDDGEFETCPSWGPVVDDDRPCSPILLKTLGIHRFDHSASWPAGQLLEVLCACAIMLLCELRSTFQMRPTTSPRPSRGIRTAALDE